MALTLRKDERVLKSIEFRRALRHGRRCRTPHLTLVTLIRPTGKVRLGLTVSRKVGNAVIRNRVKRRLREIVRLHRSRLGRPWDLVIIAQPGAGALSYHEFLSELMPVLDELARQDEVAAGGGKPSRSAAPGKLKPSELLSTDSSSSS